jgi:L-fucose mutarotase
VRRFRRLQNTKKYYFVNFVVEGRDEKARIKVNLILCFTKILDFQEDGMLKGISKLISPDLLKILMEMGHGDELVIADGNYPAASNARRLVRADGLGTSALLEGIMQLFPLDSYVERPVALMAVVPGDPYQPVIWEDYRKIILKAEPGFKDFEMVERFAFYERASRAYAVLATGEAALYANIILKKGVIK